MKLLRFAIGVLTTLATTLSATTLYVDLNSPGPTPPYTNWPTAATNIQDAIDVADPGDLVLVTNGVYATGGRVVYGAMTNRVAVTKPVTVQSVNGPTVTVIRGYGFVLDNTEIRCVYLTNGSALTGFMLTNGATLSSGDAIKEMAGAGVWCESSACVVSNCIIIRNRGWRFGGGACSGTFNNCTFSSNSCRLYSGGGAYLSVLNDCTLIGNWTYSENGGGAASSTLNNCTLSANSANNGGGAFDSVLNNCVITNNSSVSGGGLCLGVANNCIISGNHATQYGGGATSNVLNNCVLRNNLVDGGFGYGGGAFYCALASCTVVSNTAGNGVTRGSGGGVYFGGATNCIIYYNLAESGRNVSGAVLNNSDTFPLASGFGNISNAPFFLDSASGDFHLQSNSPCINAGNNSYVADGTDLDGNPRISGGTVDIGAYEYQSPSSVLSYAWAQQYGLTTDGLADFTDLDGDDLNNYGEWRSDTNPTNELSVLRMDSVTNSPTGAQVVWQSVTTRSYWLERATDLEIEPPFQTIATNIVGIAGTKTFTDTSATNDGPFFYRVGVQQ
jgi:hypothetical protein